MKRRRRSGADGASSTPAETPTDPVRERTRRRLRVAGVSALVVLVLVSGHLAVLGMSLALGDRAWRDGRHEAAERWFTVADRIDVVERWKAPYDRGVAAFSQERWLDAAELFERARQHAPEEALCRVVLNESLSWEVLGDQLAESGDQAGARARWTRAEEVLAEAQGCSTDGGQGDGGDDDADDSGSGDASDDASEGGESEGGQDSDGADGDDQGDDAQEGASEAEQMEEAARRLREKVTGSPQGNDAGTEGATPEEQAAQLEERASGAARRRAEQQDDSAPGGQGTQDGPTW